MSNEKKIEINIEKLGPVKDSTIELKPFMVFTGESGTGKSYTSLLVHFVYRVFSNTVNNVEIRDFFRNIGASFDDDKEQLIDDEGFLFEFTLQKFEDWINNAAIKYVSNATGNFNLEGKVKIRFYGLPEKFRFYYKKEVVEIGGEMKYYDTIIMNKDYPIRLPYSSQYWGNIPYEALFVVYIKNIYGISQDKTFLLPPSRGGLVCLNDIGRGEFTNSPAGMYKEFINDFGQLKSAAPAENKNLEEYSSLSNNLISGKINIHDNELFYEQSYGEIPITASAASIKELAPFAIMLQKGLVEQYSITFEEPETNIHPELQIKAAETIAFLLQKGCRFRVTTHNDYFLQRINQLIKLGFVNDISETPLYIDKNKISAYYFDKTEDNTTSIKHLEVSKNGIPFSTFFDTVNKLSEEEDRINNLLDKYADKLSSTDSTL